MGLHSIVFKDLWWFWQLGEICVLSSGRCFWNRWLHNEIVLLHIIFPYKIYFQRLNLRCLLVYFCGKKWKKAFLEGTLVLSFSYILILSSACIIHLFTSFHLFHLPLLLTLIQKEAYVYHSEWAVISLHIY